MARFYGPAVVVARAADAFPAWVRSMKMVNSTPIIRGLSVRYALRSELSDMIRLRVTAM